MTAEFAGMVTSTEAEDTSRARNQSHKRVKILIRANDKKKPPFSHKAFMHMCTTDIQLRETRTKAKVKRQKPAKNKRCLKAIAYTNIGK